MSLIVDSSPVDDSHEEASDVNVVVQWQILMYCVITSVNSAMYIILSNRNEIVEKVKRLLSVMCLI